jgi:hypothetical protein
MDENYFGENAVLNRPLLITASTLLLLAGCATDPKAVQSNSETYQVAFAKGCDSAAAKENPYYMFEKDARAYRTDAAYFQGWKQGYQSCSGKAWPGNTALLFRQMEPLPDQAR